MVSDVSKGKTIMNNTIQQQIINFIDEHDSVTYKQIIAFVNNENWKLYAFEELLQDGQIRQVVADKNLGTYKYCLAA